MGAFLYLTLFCFFAFLLLKVFFCFLAVFFLFSKVFSFLLFKSLFFFLAVLSVFDFCSRCLHLGGWSETDQVCSVLLHYIVHSVLNREKSYVDTQNCRHTSWYIDYRDVPYYIWKNALEFGTPLSNLFISLLFYLVLWKATKYAYLILISRKWFFTWVCS